MESFLQKCKPYPCPSPKKTPKKQKQIKSVDESHVQMFFCSQNAVTETVGAAAAAAPGGQESRRGSTTKATKETLERSEEQTQRSPPLPASPEVSSQNVGQLTETFSHRKQHFPGDSDLLLLTDQSNSERRQGHFTIRERKKQLGPQSKQDTPVARKNSPVGRNLEQILAPRGQRSSASG